MGGKAIQVVKEINVPGSINKQYTFDEETFNEIFKQDKTISDKPFMMVSVSGEFRTGKSLLLNFMIRYLMNPSEFIDWLNDSNSRLDGFISRFGQNLETVGIWIWSEPYIIQDLLGNDVVILLMDTQGFFDRKHTRKDYLTLLTLSLSASSVQILNFMKNIQENDMDVIDVFIERGLYAYDRDSRIFGKLVLLIRDFIWIKRNGLGYSGGQKFMEDELGEIIININKACEQVECFLLPHPGEAIEKQDNYDGNLSHVDGSFKQEIFKFLSQLFDPANLKVKKTNGEIVYLRNLPVLMKNMLDKLNNEDMPGVESFYETSLRLCFIILIDDMVNIYKDKMDKVMNKLHDENDLIKMHYDIRDFVLMEFDRRKGILSEARVEDCKSEMLRKIAAEYINYKNANIAREVAQNKRFKRTVTETCKFASMVVGLGIACVPGLPIEIALGIGIGCCVAIYTCGPILINGIRRLIKT